MEKESFEDPEVARLMNDAFISIKVDREERPDIDGIYMTVCQLMTGSGGWPLTIILTPDKKPFFAGTYFPKESRLGHPGMLDLIPQIKELWGSQKAEVEKSAREVTSALSPEPPAHGEGGPDEEFLHKAYEGLFAVFDERNGGFGSAPKFPTPHNLTFLLRYWKRTGDEWALKMVEKTLRSMSGGGIFDQIGFGFHRYSTDPRWIVPHFEKMLYDQALLVMAYVEAYQATGRSEYLEVVDRVLTYVLRDMADADGGFFSAEDADSEGEEGRFYLWREDEVRDVLNDEEADLVVSVFNIERNGNFIDPSLGAKNESNIPYLKSGAAPKTLHEGVIEAARLKLFEAREKRTRPGRDDKVLADWNGLMIAALAKASQVSDSGIYLEAAGSAADFILTKMIDREGRLFHRYREGELSVPAFLDDYAFITWGLIELYEAGFEVKYLENAMRLTREMIELFWDDDGKGFYFSGKDAEVILLRKKELYDGAVPSGNSVAMMNLLRLGRIAEKPEYEEMASKLFCAFSSDVSSSPKAYTQLMSSLSFALGPSSEVVIVGDPDGEDTHRMLKALRSRFLPDKVVVFRPVENVLPDISDVAEYTRSQSSIDGKATAYVCRNYACAQPTADAGKMLELLLR